MGRLTTHVLDTARGKPGAGIRLELYRLDAGRVLAAGAVTNADGRCPQPLLEGDAFRAGRYELVFFAGAYKKERLQKLHLSCERAALPYELW